MNIITSEFYKNILHETGISFIYGITTASIKGILNNKTNFLVKQLHAIRKGTENARFTFLYNTIVHILLKIQMKMIFANALAFFISSYIVGIRNGTFFALKNASFGFFLTLFNKLISFYKYKFIMLNHCLINIVVYKILQYKLNVELKFKTKK